MPVQSTGNCSVYNLMHALFFWAQEQSNNTLDPTDCIRLRGHLFVAIDRALYNFEQQQVDFFIFCIINPSVSNDLLQKTLTTTTAHVRTKIVKVCRISSYLHVFFFLHNPLPIGIIGGGPGIGQIFSK